MSLDSGAERIRQSELWERRTCSDITPERHRSSKRGLRATRLNQFEGDEAGGAGGRLHLPGVLEESRSGRPALPPGWLSKPCSPGRSCSSAASERSLGPPPAGSLQPTARIHPPRCSSASAQPRCSARYLPPQSRQALHRPLDTSGFMASAWRLATAAQKQCPAFWRCASNRNPRGARAACPPHEPPPRHRRTLCTTTECTEPSETHGSLTLTS